MSESIIDVNTLKQQNKEKLQQLMARLKAEGFIKDPAFEEASKRVRVEDYIPVDLLPELEDFYDDIGSPAPFYAREPPYSRSTGALHAIAVLVQYLELEPSDTVIVCGAKSGYLESIIAEMEEDVHIIVFEALQEVADLVRQNVKKCGYAEKIEVILGNPLENTLKLIKEHPKPYKILMTGQIPVIPTSLITNLLPNSRLVAPVGPDKRQTIYRIIITAEVKPNIEDLGCFKFSPLFLKETLENQDAMLGEPYPLPVPQPGVDFINRFKVAVPPRLKRAVRKSKSFSFSRLFAYEVSIQRGNLGLGLMQAEKITEQFAENINKEPIKIDCPLELKENLKTRLQVTTASHTCENLQLDFFPVPRLGLLATIGNIKFEVSSEAFTALHNILQQHEMKDQQLPAIKGRKLAFQLNMTFIISASGVIICDFDLAPLNVEWPVIYYHQLPYLSVIRDFINYFQPEKNLRDILIVILNQIIYNSDLKQRLKDILIEYQHRDLQEISDAISHPNKIEFAEFLPDEVITVPIAKADFAQSFDYFAKNITPPKFNHKFAKYPFGIIGNADVLYFLVVMEDEKTFRDLLYSSNIAYLRILSDYVFLLQLSDRLYGLSNASMHYLTNAIHQNGFLGSQRQMFRSMESLKSLEMAIMQRFFLLDLTKLRESYNRIAWDAAKLAERFAYEDVRAAYEEMNKMFMNTLEIEMRVNGIKGSLDSLRSSFKDVNDIISSKREKTMNWLLLLLTVVSVLIPILQAYFP